MATYKVRTQDNGPIGGFTAKISVDGGQTWHQIRKYVGGGLCSFDSKAQALKAADKEARKRLRS